MSESTLSNEKIDGTMIQFPGDFAPAGGTETVVEPGDSEHEEQTHSIKQ